jgi:hypothetical protein
LVSVLVSVSDAATLPLPARAGEDWRRGSELNRRIEVLQTSALPLGYRAISKLPRNLLSSFLGLPRISTPLFYSFQPTAPKRGRNLGRNQYHEHRPSSRDKRSLVRPRKTSEQGKIAKPKDRGQPAREVAAPQEPAPVPAFIRCRDADVIMGAKVQGGLAPERALSFGIARTRRTITDQT